MGVGKFIKKGVFYGTNPGISHCPSWIFSPSVYIYPLIAQPPGKETFLKRLDMRRAKLLNSLPSANYGKTGDMQRSDQKQTGQSGVLVQPAAEGSSTLRHSLCVRRQTDMHIIRKAAAKSGLSILMTIEE